MTAVLVWSNAGPRGKRLVSPWGEAVVAVYFDAARGLVSVEHDGTISWDELQAVKNHWFGAHRTAIEIYPPADAVVNNVPMRHLWRLGDGEWWPDLGREGEIEGDSLRDRYERAAGGL